MPETTPVLSLPRIQPAQAQKHVTHNEALRTLDVVVQAVVADRDRTEPPAAPAAGARHIVAASAVDGWAGQDTKIAFHDEGAWHFVAAQAGWRVHVLSEGADLRFDGSDWIVPPVAGDGAPLWGISATADATNRLSVSSPATLLNHAGAGHQLKVNKAAPGDTASLLFQTGFSGRAEMGTAGTDDFAVKVSADGSTFVEALRIAGATGLVTGAAVQQSAADVTAGRLMRADFGYGPGNVLGTVGQTAGVPTGAVIETGGGAGGRYVRLADGTQVCTQTLTTSASGTVTWTYPAPFAAAPRVTATASSATPRVVTSQGAGATTCLVNGWDMAAARAAVATDLVAVGTWF